MRLLLNYFMFLIYGAFSTHYAPPSTYSHVECSEGKFRNFFFGIRLARDRLMYGDAVYFKQRDDEVITEDKIYPPLGEIPKGHITCVEVHDHFCNGTGGHVSIVKGKLGEERVKLRFVSQKSYGMAFTIHVYGH